MYLPKLPGVGVKTILSRFECVDCENIVDVRVQLHSAKLLALPAISEMRLCGYLHERGGPTPHSDWKDVRCYVPPDLDRPNTDEAGVGFLGPEPLEQLVEYAIPAMHFWRGKEITGMEQNPMAAEPNSKLHRSCILTYFVACIVPDCIGSLRYNSESNSGLVHACIRPPKCHQGQGL